MSDALQLVLEDEDGTQLETSCTRFAVIWQGKELWFQQVGNNQLMIGVDVEEGDSEYANLLLRPYAKGSVRVEVTDPTEPVRSAPLVPSLPVPRAMTLEALRAKDTELEQARVAVLPCCHDLDAGDAGGLSGWLDGALAMDVTRAARLRRHGYRVSLADDGAAHRVRVVLG